MYSPVAASGRAGGPSGLMQPSIEARGYLLSIYFLPH